MSEAANKGKLAGPGIADPCSEVGWSRGLTVCGTAAPNTGTAWSLSIAFDFALRALGA